MLPHATLAQNAMLSVRTCAHKSAAMQWVEEGYGLRTLLPVSAETREV